jgi:HPt (histidine-containing phosphotransfer) domain-containing protein
VNDDRGRDALDAAMAALRLEYAQRLDGDLARVAEAIELLARDLGDSAAKERARFEAHRLKGSAGTFGFHGVSARAAELEELVLAVGKPSGRTPSELAVELRAGLAALLAAR